MSYISRNFSNISHWSSGYTKMKVIVNHNQICTWRSI